MSTSLPYSFSTRGLAYQSGLDAVRQAAEAAETAVRDQIATKLDELRAYAADPTFIGACDERGVVIWSQDQILELEMERLVAAQFELRRAFVLAAYHYWESAVCHWDHQVQGSKHERNRHQNHQDEPPPAKFTEIKDGFAGLFVALRRLAGDDPALAQLPDGDLHAVADLANIIKHRSQRAFDKLIKKHPDGLAGALVRGDGQMHPARDVRLTPDHLAWVFEVVRRSGTQPNLPQPLPRGAGDAL